MFCPFGEGDVDIEAVITALRARDYRGWLVVEQDQALGTSDTPASVIAGQRFNLEYLRRFEAESRHPIGTRRRRRSRQPAGGPPSRLAYARRNDAVASTTRSTSASVWAPVRKPRIM